MTTSTLNRIGVGFAAVVGLLLTRAFVPNPSLLSGVAIGVSIGLVYLAGLFVGMTDAVRQEKR